MMDELSTDKDAAIADIPKTASPVRKDFHSLLINDVPLIDVRAPVEFTKGAFPESSNLPLMNDDERHQVGIRYKQAGQDKAIELGAALISDAERSKRIESWTQFARAHPTGALYCFRGGLRSRIAQAWLKSAGVDYPVVEGGYKALRNYLLESLVKLTSTLDFILIGGRTGSGKTNLLTSLQAGVVDLEHLARHRGSSFGKLGTPQPSNIDFENALTVELLKLEFSGTNVVYLEDEARMIGRVCIPEPLRDAMVVAPIYQLETSMDVRVENCLDDYVVDLCFRYQDRLGDREGFEAFRCHHLDGLDRIRKRLGDERHTEAVSLLKGALKEHESTGATAQYADFIELMLSNYYDPMYDYQLSKKQERIVFSGDAQAILEKVNP